jgi:cell division protein FtsN
MQSCDFFQKRNMFSGDSDSARIYREKQDSLEFVDSIKNLQNRIARLQIRNQQLRDSVRARQQESRVSKSGYKYHVIVGSFKTREYLNSYNRHIQEKGFETRILQNRYGFHLVAVESTNNWNQALSTLEEIQQSFLESSWLYVEK